MIPKTKPPTLKEFTSQMERLNEVKQYCVISESSGQFIINCHINKAGTSVLGAIWKDRSLGARKSF